LIYSMEMAGLMYLKPLVSLRILIIIVDNYRGPEIPGPCNFL
jgi:hypothetical protein